MNGMSRRGITIIDDGKGGAGPGGGGGKPADDGWKAKLTRNRDGLIEGTLHNLIMILENDDRLAGLFWLNDSNNQVVMARKPPWSGSNRDEFADTDSSELAAWLQHPDKYHMRCGDDIVLKAVIAVARRHRRHPIREYLTGLRWDGKPRIKTMLSDMFGAEATLYSEQSAFCFMVGAVARILWVDPKNLALGAKVDFMLVLEGEQGKQKSSALSELFDLRWFVETNESPTGKDFYQVIQGCWGVEIGEMDSFGRAEVTSVKVAITRRTDKFRAPYERMPKSYRRESVFVGTTNEREYLRDATGGRRFLPVRSAGSADIPRIVSERDQLWAEAVRLFAEGFEFWKLPDDAAAEQEARYISDSWEGRIERWLDGRMDDRHTPERLKFSTGQVVWTTTDELLEFAIGVDPAKHTVADQMRVAKIMKRFGRVQINNDGPQEDSWDHQRKRWPGGGREQRWVRISADGRDASNETRGGDVPGF